MNVFYVNQGVTFEDERSGGFVWSPKSTKNGRENAGFYMMTQISEGDFILHNCNGELVAVSIANTNCFEADKPTYKKIQGNNWAKEGYKVETCYKILEKTLKISDYREWLEKNYKKDSAFTIKGKSKQQYMSLIDYKHAIYLLKEAINLQPKSNTDTINMLEKALSDIIEDKKGEYEQGEMELIEDLVDSNQGKKPTWAGIATPQEMILSTSFEKEKPKRNLKIAADALARADYKCEFDINDRVFERKSGKGYTEPHHLIPISKYRDFNYKKVSLDVMENIVSLCSHCHNLIHYGRYEVKKPVLEKLYNDRKTALEKVGLKISFEDLVKYYK